MREGFRKFITHDSIVDLLGIQFTEIGPDFVGPVCPSINAPTRSMESLHGGPPAFCETVKLRFLVCVDPDVLLSVP
jgi:acyl-coenzyme A thioesterase PaaI-like protein